MIKILEYGKVKNEEIFSRAVPAVNVEKIVADIIENVKNNGDKALKEYCEKFDGAHLLTLKVSEEEIAEAFNSVGEEFIGILKHAEKNITEFHKHQKREGFEFINPDGATVGQKITPVAVAGIYVPAGTAAYPSTVLMDAIPAKIAGVNKIVMTTPSKGGKIAPEILAAAKIAGVDEIYKVGGAQAIAALAFGTESVPKADKIVGPGNAYVAEAKKQVFGKVSIDMIAGPSEILVVADKDNNPAFVAADLLSQAEHDKMASAVLITDDKKFADCVSEQIEIRIKELERYDIARASIDNNGKIIVVNDIEKAMEVANEIAPEHLEICVKNAEKYLGNVKNAGSVFLGKFTPEAVGDYMAGPNHTLPTMGTAKFSSPLSVDDFIKKTQYIFYDEKALMEICDKVAVFAAREGLTAHAKSATVRKGEKNE